MRSPYFACIWSATSTTGPQTRDWHSCGVANSSATGLRPSTSANDFACMSEGGLARVSIEATSPRAEPSVSVLTFGGRSPTPGMRSSRPAITLIWPGAAKVLAPVLRDREDRVAARPLERDLRGVDGGERVRLGRRLLGAVAALGDEHVGGRRVGALGRPVGVGGDVDGGLAVDEARAVVDDPEREPVRADGEDRAREPELGPRGAGSVGHLLQRAALGGREVGGRHGLRRAHLRAHAALGGDLRRRVLGV